MRTLRFVLGDQLSRGIASLRDADPASDVVLMAEVAEEATYVRHHRQKLVLVLSAMRHFAAQLAAEGFTVDYVRLDARGNGGSFCGELTRAAREHRPERVLICDPGEFRVRAALQAWRGPRGERVEFCEDDRFLVSRARFERWAAGRRSFRMEHFYREMRRETGLLMEGGAPAGGQWNFDAENRKPWPAGAVPPTRLRFEPDDLTREVMALVADRFPEHFGSIEGFGWAVTRVQALELLEHFVAVALPRFGDHQDAMVGGEPWLCHSLLAPALNLGLLTAREVCGRAERAYRSGAAPLNAVEGFVRQVLGWREYVRGIYWLRMPGYAASNALEARRPLPHFYWTGETQMRCVSEVVRQTERHAYAHHIQRLMITGNFALLAGIEPAQIEAWYLAVYADAFEWVELPNTHGMAMYADGGLLASKPYAASGAYIDRMSDYCAGCRYDVRQKTGPRACPFNYLYWAFLIRNQARLQHNPRMAMPYRTLATWDDTRRESVCRMADAFLDTECGSARPAFSPS